MTKNNFHKKLYPSTNNEGDTILKRQISQKIFTSEFYAPRQQKNISMPWKGDHHTAKTSVNMLTLYDVYLEQQIININRCSI